MDKGIIRLGSYEVTSSSIGSWEDRLPVSVTKTELMSGGALTLEPGAQLDKRICSCDEMTMYVIAGEGKAEIAEEAADISQYTLMHVFGGQQYSVANTGSEPMRIICYMSPAHKEEGFI